jgi:inosose dehydratase
VDTDPGLISLCLDTGHHTYRGGSPVAFMRKHHQRVAYLHLKNVDRAILKKVQAEAAPLATAMGVFCPAEGVVEFVALRDVLHEVGYEGFAALEQDMYPAAFDKPLPIAQKTRAYLRSIGLG